ncbi:MAG: hypothetical protein AAGF26_16200 [Cyanobacteria bacterium P01_G01_bin.49]
MNYSLLQKIWIKAQKNPQSGLTLLQLLIIILMAGIIAYLILPRLSKRPNNRVILGVATQNLMLFAKQNNLTPIKCLSNDADNDGWVDCQVENEQQESMTIQCGYDQRHQSCQFFPSSNQE